MDWEGWTDDSGERRGSLEVLRARDVESIGKDRRPVHHVGPEKATSAQVV